MNLFLFTFLLILCTNIGAIRDIEDLSKNVSSTLDHLLASNRYDKRIRPGFGGPPVQIQVNFLVKSIGPVSENDQSFGLDLYFRQNWYDLRLKFEKLQGLDGFFTGMLVGSVITLLHPDARVNWNEIGLTACSGALWFACYTAYKQSLCLDEFSLSWLFLDKVWKPDTYFVNGKKSFLHRITAPNKFLRLRYDGYLTYSMRLTISASCPMYLRKFPLDSQRCPLILGSYGYTSKDVVYQWESAHPIVIEKGMELAQFDLVNVTTEDETLQMRGGQHYSTLKTLYWLQRHTGYFMLQVYVPCGLIVLCSWVSFWIDPDDVAARVALGVTTVLSLTTMGFGGRAQLPKVSYWTALDWFVIICFTSVFSVMIEYACVNFIDKVTKDLKKVIEQKKKDKEENLEKEAKEDISLTAPTLRQRSASLSTPSAAAEAPCRRTSVADPVALQAPAAGGHRKASLLDKIPDIRQFQRKLSTTVREWIDIPALQDKISRSMQNLSRLERGFRDPDMNVPRVVVSDEDDGAEIAVDLEDDEDDVWLDDDEPEPEIAPPTRTRTLLQLWLQWKFLPQEIDVLRLMEASEPPDKFSKIDIDSRKGFPIAFFTSLTLYLVAFAYYLTDEFPERDTDVVLYKN